MKHSCKKGGNLSSPSLVVKNPLYFHPSIPIQVNDFQKASFKVVKHSVVEVNDNRTARNIYDADCPTSMWTAGRTTWKNIPCTTNFSSLHQPLRNSLIINRKLIDSIYHKANCRRRKLCKQDWSTNQDLL